jgi:exodeoxyribonuclease V gamma subunit
MIARIRPPAVGRRDWALAHLETLVDLFDRGMREPVPLFCATSAAYAEAAATGGDPGAAGRREWTSPWNFDREDKDLEHQLVLGGVRTFDELLADRPRPDEDWDTAETTRLGRYARRLWGGLLASEELSVR